MKYDPVNQVYYDHTPAEWAKAKGGHIAMSLPASVAARLKNREQEQLEVLTPNSADEV